MKDDANARLRAEVILKVQAGLMSASDAAKLLGVSRKTYYKWEKRGLEAMLQSLCERDGGRPRNGKDTEKEMLREEVDLLRTQRKQRLSNALKSDTKKKERKPTDDRRTDREDT